MTKSLHIGPISDVELQTLETCQNYPIRTIGHIQPHGILLVLKSSSLSITQASANTNSALGLSPEDLLGKSLTSIFPDEEVEDLRTCLRESDNFGVRTLTARITGEQFYIYLHLQQDIILLELEPVRTDAFDLESLQRQISQMTTVFEKTTTILELSQRLAKEIRALINFDRVMIYQFLSDQSGIVIAEEKHTGIESYLGLHYPATDIPAEARAVFTENPLRCIPDINYSPAPIIQADKSLTQKPLDISATWLRGVAPAHVEYLKNMGVVSSLTMPLLDESGLWGLISCHHSQPTYTTAETRSILVLLSKVASLNLFRQQQLERNVYREQRNCFLTDLKAARKQDDASLQQVLIQNSQLLLDVFKSEGLAFIFEQDITIVGTTPSEADIRGLARWLKKKPDPTFSTCALSQEYSEENICSDLPAGLLSISAATQHSQSIAYHIVLFRPEQLQTVSWAGQLNYTCKFNEYGELELGPRKSFELWKEQVRGQSLPWSAQELETASDLHSVLMQVALNSSEAALRAKSEFLANMSHEIRTPMNAVIGITELLNETELDTRQKKYVSIIRTGSDTLLTVINDILDFSKIESKKMILEMGRLDLYQCIEDVTALFSNQAAEKGLTLTNRIESGNNPYVFKGDLVRLRQILGNFVSNSIKFTESGAIEVSLKVHSIRSAPAKKDTAYQYKITGKVKDTGIGISPKTIQHLFQPFSQADASITRRYGGTGLGLAINKELIELMGGEIWVESEIGKGTTFGFSIKLEPYEPLILAYYLEKKTELRQKHLLVVDGNEVSRHHLRRQAESLNLEVCIEHSAGGALVQLFQEKRFDAISISDQLPDMDSHQLALKISSIPDFQTIPIILVQTQQTRSLNDKDALDSRITLLQKPVSQESLRNALIPLFLDETLSSSEQFPDRQLTKPKVSAETPLRILLAEDIPLNRIVALQMLRSCGYRADTVNNGNEVLTALHHQPYDLVLMDIQMPEMDGLTATRQVRLAPDIIQPYIVAMTASSMQGDRERCLAAGMDDYISKPIRKRQLREVIQQCPRLPQMLM